jgi:NodT family efflux transporter outer membrane factor (OMF) lipoprotein
MNRTRLALALAQLLGVAGCSLAPAYVVPHQAVPSNYKGAGLWKMATPSDQLLRGDWWQLLKDPTLNSLEERVNDSNPDLAAALDRYNESKAYENEANSAMYPTAQGIGAVSRNRQSDNRPLRGSNQPDVYGANTLGLSANYELDLWGRVRNLVTFGKATMQASAAELESTRLALHASLASDYLELRGLDSRTQLLTETMNSYRSRLAFIENRYKGGIASARDVARAQAQLEEAQTDVADVMARRSLLEHAIAALVGEPASTFSIASSTEAISQPEIPVSVPSTLLQRRPDISAAERRVAAANAEIGIARSAFFPSINLGLLGGYQNTGEANLLTAPNTFWSIGPTALLTLFDAGRRDAEVERARARTDEAAAQYRATVLRAFKEVEDNLTLLRQLHEEESSEQAAAASAQRSYDLSMNRYRKGAVSYLEVIDAEDAVLQIKRSSLDIRTRSLLASIGLIRSLGGGWNGNPDTPVAAAPGNADNHD